jgi:uncharacterized membrane protein YgdD (TMEM256/DUF423 family)
MPAPAKPFRFPLLASGLLGLTGVALGAIGAHAFRAALLEHGTAQSWETAARYHLFHALAALAVAAWVRAGPAGLEQRRDGAGRSGATLLWAVRAWCAGVVLFSGSLYGYALGGPRWLVHVTPVGGIALLLGWLAVVIAAYVKDE